ncbi:protein of unknown function [Micromonospora pattaloongensis]|uniref:DUF4190 domain-containing protein n=1 Tax=Micromonospora pattaloongensis TaxID=405436 RepID=A0A1H3GRU2_9ACTN|nr:DUF4190 domain-containing protein [Micromonospora pattaloongensis]SDY05184.1 protein of unknown function [Micromonospora pattaloongensis]
MTQPEQPGPWSAPSGPAQQPTGSQDPTYQMAAQPTTEQPLPGPPPVGQPGHGQFPPAGYAPPAPGYPPYGYPVMAAPPSNGLSIASLVVSIVGIVGLCGYGLGGYLGIAGAVLGHVSRRQIRTRAQLGQPESGDGMALAGIIMGWIATVVAVLATAALVIFFVWLANQEPSGFSEEY